MAKEITQFRGEWRYLSNFWPDSIVFGGIEYPTAEHAFQAQKTLTVDIRRDIAGLASPGAAKRYGRTVALRADWEQVKKRAMLMVVLAKFIQNPDLAAQLVATEDAYLEEGNTWHDNFWGSCGCPAHIGEGLNYLGRILMMVRDIVRVDG
jgi:hypothetical protein